jgi:nitroreductase
MIELLRNRRSIRKYTDEPVEAEKLEILKEALLRAPSSKNINPWEFIFIDDREIIQKLAQCKPHGTLPLVTAPLAVIICADETKNDVWIEDCSIASILLQLTAQTLGLGSCWIQVRNRSYMKLTSSEEYIQQLIGIPKNYRVLNIVAAGYAQTLRKGKPVSELQFEKIKTNRFQQG